MDSIYTTLAKKRAEQSTEPRSQSSVPPLPEKPRLHGAQKKEKQQNGTPQADPHLVVKTRPVKPRHGFDIYVDQYEQLVKWANEEKLQGGTGSMSRMAREALDMYIASRKKK
jgi:soluble cytochrome b562